MQPLIYWKEEKQQRQWKLIPDVGSERQKAIKAGAMFMTWNSFSEEPGNGSEPVRYGDFPLDFDSSDPGKALQDLKTLCFVHLEDLFGVDAYSVRYFCSGSKGYHATIPAYCFGSQEGDPYLPLIYKKIAMEFKEILQSKTLDLSLYCMGKGKMFRLENVKRSNGCFKVPLTLEEIRDLSSEEIKELSKSPRTIEPVDVDEGPVSALVELYQKMKAEVYKELKEKPEPEKLDPEAITKLSKELPDCLKYILKEMPTSEKCNFNRLTLVLITYFQMFKTPKTGIWKAVKGFLEGYPHSQSYNTSERRLEHFNSQFEYLKDNPDYGFSCAFVKGLGLPGSAFDCEECFGEKKNKDTATDFELITMSEIHDMEIEFPPPLIDGLLRVGDSLLITGSTGLGKSLTVNAVALAVASGEKLFDAFGIGEPRTVLIFQSENSLEATKIRIVAMMDLYKENAKYDQYRDALTRIVTPIRNMDCRIAGDIMNTAFANQIKESIQAVDAGLIIFDPLISFHRQQENANTDMREALDRLTEILNETGTSTVLSHHHGKGDYEGAKQARGATAIIDWSRGILTLNRQPHENRDLVKVSHTKAGNFSKAKDFLLEIVGASVTQTEFDVLCPPQKVREALEGLGSQVNSKNQLVDEIVRINSVSRRTALDAISDAIDMGFLRAAKTGNRYKISVK